MATETEQLVIALEARVRDFEKNFQRASRTANDNFAGIEKRAKKSADNLEKTMAGASSRIGGAFKNFGAGLAGGILGGLTVAGLQQIAKSIGDVANGVAMIGSNAKRAGLTNKTFQELSYVAGQARIDVDALTDGMKELNLRADEFITTGSGSGAESFQRLGYSAAELKEKLKDPSALLVDIIGRLQQLDKAAQIRIADELFGGTAGERFVELLDRGADGIRSMIKEANEFGLVLDDDVIAKADEIDRKFDLISKTISTKLKGAVVTVTGELMEFMDKLKDVEERQSATLGNQLADLGGKRLQNENQILKLRSDKENTIGGALVGPVYDKQIQFLEAENQKIAEAEQRILKVLGERDEKESAAKKAAADAVPDITKLNTSVTSGKSATDSAAKSLQSYGDAIRALKGDIPELADEVAELNMRADIDKSYRAALQNARTMGQVYQANALRDQALAAIPGRMQEIRDKKSDDASKEARQKAEEQIKAYSDIIAGAQEFISSQQQEATALGMSADAATAYRLEMEMLNQAKRDGLDLSDDQRREIATYAQGMAHAQKVTDQLAQSQEQATEISQFFGEQAVDALTGIATGSMTAMDALRQLLATLIRLLLQAAFLGEGPLAGSLKGTGGIFGNLGKALSSSTSPAAVSAGTGSPVAKIAEQTFAAPLGKVERSPLAPVSNVVDGLRGTISPEITKPAMQEATKNFANSIALSPQEITDLKKTVMTEWVSKQGDMQGKGIIDTILNRKASGKWGDSVTDVVNARKQFSAINGPERWNGRDRARGVQDIPDSALLSGRGKRASELVDRYLPERAAGAPSVVGDHLNYANRAASTPNNFGWIDKLQGPKFGGHQHGTTADLQKYRPGDFGVSLPKETVPPGLDMASTGSIATQQTQAIQQQLDAQRQLAEQMAMTQQATSAMQQPLQGVQMAATQVVPNLGGMQQGMTGLLGPLTSAIPATGQFGGAVQSLIQQMMAMPMGGGGAGLFSLLGFKGGGEISGPGTSTSDSIPIMASDGEFMVNARAAKKHRSLLETINSGRVPALAAGGMIRGGSFAASTTFAPSMSFNVTGSGNQRQDAALAGLIAAQVDRSLDKHKPDTFRRSAAQMLTRQAGDMRHATGRNG